jgi:site-specific recombinase
MHRLDTALAAFATESTSASLVADLVAAVRPHPWESAERGAEHFERLIERLEADAHLRAQISRHLIGWMAGTRMTSFFTDSGILPATGFFSEGWRRLVHQLLPDVVDTRQLRDCVRMIFSDDRDWAWLHALPQDHSARFWRLISAPDVADPAHWRAIAGQLLDALLVLAHRLSGIGFDDELMRAMPEFDAQSARFTGLAIEVHRFSEGYRAMLEHRAQTIEDERHILVLCDQCTDSFDRLHRMARTHGTSLHLTYLLERGQASLRRIECIARLLGSPLREGMREAGVKAWADLMREALRAETRRPIRRRCAGTG